MIGVVCPWGLDNVLGTYHMEEQGLFALVPVVSVIGSGRALHAPVIFTCKLLILLCRYSSKPRVLCFFLPVNDDEVRRKGGMDPVIRRDTNKAECCISAQ